MQIDINIEIRGYRNETKYGINKVHKGTNWKMG